MISSAEASQMAAQMLTTQAITNRYAGAEIASERSQGQYSIYRLSTNATVLPVELVVDRKTGNMTLQKSNQ